MANSGVMIYNISLTTVVNILELIYEVIAPDLCFGCSSVGSVLCAECSERLWFPDQCYLCKIPTVSSLVCASCRSKTKLTGLSVSTEYGGTAIDIIYALKYRASRSGARRVGELIAAGLPYLDPQTCVVTFIPTTGDHRRARGYDHAQEIARAVANVKNLRCVPLLHRQNSAHQVGASKTERLETVVLVDDVLTTGATLESGARALHKAGHAQIYGAVFARTV